KKCLKHQIPPVPELSPNICDNESILCQFPNRRQENRCDTKCYTAESLDSTEPHRFLTSSLQASSSSPNAYERYPFPPEIYVLHLPLRYDFVGAPRDPRTRAELVRPPSSPFSRGSWKLLPDSIFVFDILKNQVDSGRC